MRKFESCPWKPNLRGGGVSHSRQILGLVPSALSPGADVAKNFPWVENLIEQENNLPAIG
jgi:hypothetical protein